MWISKRCFRAIMDNLEALEKRIADLEEQVQGQQSKKKAEDAVSKAGKLLGFRE